MLIVDGVMLENYDVRCEEGILQIGVMDIARPYAVQGEKRLSSSGKKGDVSSTEEWGKWQGREAPSNLR